MSISEQQLSSGPEIVPKRRWRRRKPPATWSVVVIDMFNYMDSEDGEETVEGFLRPEDAIDYARRRMRSSLEEQRVSARV